MTPGNGVGLGTEFQIIPQLLGPRHSVRTGHNGAGLYGDKPAIAARHVEEFVGNGSSIRCWST